MNIYSILATGAASVYLIVGIFVYFQKKGNPVNRSFSAFLLCVSLWNVDVAGILSAPSPEMADLWGKIFRNGLLFIPPAFLHFILLFTQPSKISGRTKTILWASYLSASFFAVINWTPYLTKGVRTSPWGYHAQSGPLYPLFIIQFVLFLLLSFYYLIRGFINSNQYLRHRLKYFFLATTVSFILRGINFLAMFEDHVHLFGSICVTVGLLIAAYSIVQHRLMDVSIFMAKGLSYILSFTTLAAPFFFLIVFLEKYFFHDIQIFFALILTVLLPVADKDERRPVIGMRVDGGIRRRF